MASSTYDQRWQEAMSELQEQVHIEDPTLNDETDGTATPYQATIVEAFQHYAGLYLKYIQILSRLSECYDEMVHPQKRLEIKQVIQVIATRIVELVHQLVKWNPPNPDVRTQPERCFPWEYVAFEELLVDLKIPPETLDIPIPQSFWDEQHEAIDRRDRLVQGYLKLHGLESIQLDTVHVSEENVVFSLDEAIALLQKNERGRQGRQRGLYIQQVREEERQRLGNTFEVDPDVAAANIQRMFRGFWSRVAAARGRNAELVFIGMKAAPTRDCSVLAKRLAEARVQRRVEQREKKEEYERALLDLHDVVRSEEGPWMKEKMVEDRRRWITDTMATGKLPQDLTGYYEALKADDVVEKSAKAQAKENETKAKAPAAKKGGKKEDKKSSKGAKGKDKNKEQVEEAPEKPPPLTGPSELGTQLATGLARYENMWLNQEETANFYQKYNIALAKDVVRGPVKAQVQQEVDEMLLLQLVNIKTQLEAVKTSKRKAKTRKSTNAAAKKKGTKKNKDKKTTFPGDKLVELKGRSSDSFLSELIEHQIVHFPRPDVKVRDFLGGVNGLATSFPHSDPRDRVGNWLPPDPSAAQIRQLITAYGILPLSSPFLKARTPCVRSLLLYGPRGAGKTLLVNALANETGALVLNLSPTNLVGKFKGKKGATKLVHVAVMVAKTATFQPVILYLDDCEQIFASDQAKKTAKAGGNSDDPSRLKADLMLYVKTAFDPSDRVLVIGTSSDPGAADVKEVGTFFDKCLYLPYPDYASRVLLWKHTLRSTIAAHASHLQPCHRRHEPIDISTLAHISEGYSSGSIVETIEKTLTLRRVECLAKRPLREEEFLGPLARQAATFADDCNKFKTFTAVITGLQETREKVRLAATDAVKDDKKDGKGKKRDKMETQRTK